MEPHHQGVSWKPRLQTSGSPQGSKRWDDVLYHTPYQCWLSPQLDYTSPPTLRGTTPPNHFLPCLPFSLMFSTLLPTFLASNSQNLGSSGSIQSACSWVGRWQVRPGDTAKGMFCIPALAALLRTQKVTIKDQHTASFLKHRIQYAKLNISKLTQGSIFLLDREHSLLVLHHIPMPTALQCWILSLG